MKQLITSIKIDDYKILKAISLGIVTNPKPFSLSYSELDSNDISVLSNVHQIDYEIARPNGIHINTIRGVRFSYEGPLDSPILSDAGLCFSMELSDRIPASSQEARAMLRPIIDLLGGGLLSDHHIEINALDEYCEMPIAKYKIKRSELSTFDQLRLDMSENGTNAIDVAKTIVEIIKRTPKEKFNEQIERKQFLLGPAVFKASYGQHLLLYLSDSLLNAVFDKSIEKNEATEIFGKFIDSAIEGGLIDEAFSKTMAELYKYCFLMNRLVFDDAYKMMCLSHRMKAWDIFKGDGLFLNRFRMACKGALLMEKEDWALDIADYLGDQWMDMDLTANKSVEEVQAIVNSQRVKREASVNPALVNKARFRI